MIDLANPLRAASGRVLLLVALAGCSGGDGFPDIHEFMRGVEAKPRPGVEPLPEFEAYRPFAYSAANLRSPFEPPVAPQAGTDVEPREKHVKQHLELFPLSALVMVGSLGKDHGRVALIEDTEGAVHLVRVGDYLGDRRGQIERIEDTGVDLTEITADGTGGWLRRPRRLELRGPG